MGLQDIYYKLENGYYGLLDKIDKAGIHIYKIIDPIDKVIPSFVIILIIFAIIMLSLVYYLAFVMGATMPGTPITFLFVDKQGSPIADAQIQFTLNDEPVMDVTTSNLGTIMFEASKGDNVNLKITAGNDFEEISETITDETEYRYSLSFALAKDTINFSVNPVDGQPLKAINIDFFCSNPNVNSPDSIYNSTQTDYVLELDPECGNLSADVKSSYYDEAIIDSLSDNFSINLKPLTYSGSGAIVLAVYDSVDNSPIKDYTASVVQNGIPMQNQSLGNNFVTFSGLANTTYSVSVTKQGYFSKSEDVIVNGVTNKTIYLEKDLVGSVGQIKVSVIDYSSQNKLTGVLVSVYTQETGKQDTLVASDSTTTDNNSYIVFNISDASKNYRVNATKSGYKTQNKIVKGNDNVLVTMYVTGSERKAKIQVLDDQNYPVNNATVAIYDEQGLNVLDPVFGLTDMNGIADDKTLDEGKYKAYVYKGAYSGYSNVFTFDLSKDSDEIDATIVMTLPRSNWDITIKDKFGNVVPNALVKLYDAYNMSPISVGAKYASPQGVFNATNLRADKKYFAVISADSFENYVTIAKFLNPGSTVADDVVMEKERLNKNPVIEYLGIEDLDNKQAIKLGPNNMYKAKFKITLPNGTKDAVSYNKLYSVFLVGEANESNIIEKEMFYIDKVELSGNANLVKGRAYYQNDFDKSIGETRQTTDEVSEGTPFEDQTKWVRLNWNLSDLGITSGQLFVDVYMKVKPGTLDGTQLKLQWNMLTEGEKDNDDFTYLDPLDSKFNSDLEYALFASKKFQIFNVGEGQQVCDDKFCFELTMYDMVDDLKTSVSGEVPYVSTLGREYNMKFNLMNNNSVPLTHYRLIIENPQQNIHMTHGVVYSAQNFSNAIPSTKDFEDYFKYTYRGAETGNDTLTQNGVIKGDIYLTPIVEGTGSIKLTVIEDKTIIYTKEVYVSVNANKDLKVEIEPQVIPSFVVVPIKFTVSDANSGAYIDGADVKIVDVYNTVINTNEIKTNKDGVANFSLPRQLPNIDLRLKVFKEGYKSFEQKLKTSDKFVEITPEELKISVNITEGLGTGKLTLKNTSEIPVRISKLELTGSFDEYVNLKETNDYLKNSSLNKIIDKEHSYEMPVNVNLTTIAEQLQINKEYDAELILEISPDLNDSVPKHQRTWNFKIPVVLSLTLGKGLDNLDCLGIDVKKAELISNNGKADHDILTLVNGCTVDGKPVSLFNLEAKVNWKGNALGSFVFNRNENVARLQNAYYVTLNNKMISHEEDTFNLDFQPSSGRLAGATNAELVIRAGYFTDSGVQFVEQKTDYTVNVINMSSCISYVLPNNEVDLISVPRDQKGSFTIKNDCDNAIDLKLNVLPDQFIDLRPVDITVPAKGEKQVLIDPKFSPVGIYLLEVRGKVPKQHFEGVKVGAEALRVFIAPLETDCVVLDNYEFNLLGDGKDLERYTYIINKCLYKDVKATYTVDVKAGSFTGLCAAENWTGFLSSVMPATASSAMVGNQIGSAFHGDDKWGVLGKEFLKDHPEGVPKDWEWNGDTKQWVSPDGKQAKSEDGKQTQDVKKAVVKAPKVPGAEDDKDGVAESDDVVTSGSSIRDLSELNTYFENNKNGDNELPENFIQSAKDSGWTDDEITDAMMNAGIVSTIDAVEPNGTNLPGAEEQPVQPGAGTATIYTPQAIGTNTTIDASGNISVNGKEYIKYSDNELFSNGQYQNLPVYQAADGESFVYLNDVDGGKWVQVNPIFDESTGNYNGWNYINSKGEVVNSPALADTSQYLQGNVKLVSNVE